MNFRKAFPLLFSALLLGAGVIDSAGTKHRFENVCTGNIHDYPRPILPINLSYFHLSAKPCVASQTNMAPTAPTTAPVKVHLQYPLPCAAAAPVGCEVSDKFVGLALLEEVSVVLVLLGALVVLDSDDTTSVVLTTVLLTTVLLVTNVGVSTVILVDTLSDVGGKVAIGLLLIVNGSPHVDVGAADGEAILGMRALVEAAAGAETSTVNGSPQLLVCA